MPDTTPESLTPSHRRRVPLARAFHALKQRVALYRALTLVAALALLVAGGSLLFGSDPEAVPLGRGTAGVNVTAPPGPDAAAPIASKAKPIGSGAASYYGDELVGNPTASGERFDPELLTAAHRTLPLGSRVRVTHIPTGESVVVRINDRGPFHGQRVIDLSKAAARKIGLLKRGTGKVKLELLTAG